MWKTILLAKGAATSGSTLFSLLLQEEGENGIPIWRTITRVASAFIDIIQNWPEGVPVNGVSITLEVLKVTGLADIGEKFEELITAVTGAPQIQDTILGDFYIAAGYVGSALFLWFFGCYVRDYRLETTTTYGQQRLWENEAPILNPLTYTLKRFVPMIAVLSSFVAFIQLSFNGIWTLTNSFVQAFYEGGGITIGDAFVLLLSRMADGLSAVWFLITFGILVFGFAVVLLVYLIRLVRFGWIGMVALWIGIRAVNGKRGTTLSQPFALYFEAGVILGLTALFIRVFPGFVYSLSGLIAGVWAESLIITALIIVCFYLAWWAPKEVFSRSSPLVDRISEGLFDTDIELPDGLKIGTSKDAGFYKAADGGTIPLSLHSEETDSADYQRPGRIETLLNVVDDSERKSTGTEHSVRGSDGSVDVSEGVNEERPTGGSSSENFEAEKGYSETLYENRDSLSNDPRINDALYAWLSGIWEVQPPLQPFNEAVREAEGDLKEIRSHKPEEFEELIESGKKRKSQDEIEHGNLETITDIGNVGDASKRGDDD